MTAEKKFRSGRTSRLLSLGSLTAKVSSSYTFQFVKEAFQNVERASRSRSSAHVRNAQRVVETLGQLKGAVMKVGQYVSIQNDLLPPEFSEILASLQKAAPPVDFELVAEQIRSEFGKLPDALFSRFEREPYASASIGQVHRARLSKGTEVVVKVQYPGVEENIEGDLKNLKTILSTGGVLGYRKDDLNETFEEIRDRLYEELDYEQEVESVQLFRKAFQKDDRVLIPRVFPAYCSRRVLTLEHLPGDDLDALLAPPYSQEDRNRFGSLIFDLCCHQMFRLGILHADPHPGNFAFRKDGRLIIYDFGCLKQIPPFIQRAYRDIFRYGIRREYERVDEALLRLGSRDPRKQGPGTEFYRKYGEILREPFCSDEEPYDFGESKIHERLLELAPLGLSKMLQFKPAPETVFISRTMTGHYGNLKRVRAQAYWGRILEPYLGDH
ncbi:MAG: AarF/ABC1/UbiB kinase family protein [bacterium]